MNKNEHKKTVKNFITHTQNLYIHTKPPLPQHKQTTIVIKNKAKKQQLN